MNTSHSLRNLFGAPLVIAGALLTCESLHATLLFEDGFNYAVGALNATSVSPTGTSGNAWSAGNSHITVAGNNLTYTGLQDLGGNAVQSVWGISAGTVFNTYSAQTSGNIYYSFLLNCTVAPTSATYLTSLNPGVNPPNGSTDALQVNVGVNAGGYQIGLRTAGASAALASTVLSLNTTYLVVAEYSFATSTATLYLNPVAGGSQPTADITRVGDGSVTTIADLGFKAQNTPINGTFLIDDTRVGTSWADVTPVAAVPEPTTFALAGLAISGFALRYRRARR